MLLWTLLGPVLAFFWWSIGPAILAAEKSARSWLFDRRSRRSIHLRLMVSLVLLFGLDTVETRVVCGPRRADALTLIVIDLVWIVGTMGVGLLRPLSRFGWLVAAWWVAVGLTFLLILFGL